MIRDQLYPWSSLSGPWAVFLSASSVQPFRVIAIHNEKSGRYVKNVQIARSLIELREDFRSSRTALRMDRPYRCLFRNAMIAANDIDGFEGDGGLAHAGRFNGRRYV